METKDYKKLNEKQNQTVEEVDLNLIFSKIFNALSHLIIFLIKFLFYLSDQILKNFKLFLITIVLGSLVGLSAFFIFRPYYASSMTLSSAYYKEKFLSKAFSNLNNLAAEENYKVLGKLLQIPVAKAKALKRIEIEATKSANMQTLIDLYKETEGNKNRLDSLILNANDSTYQVNVQVYDTTALIGLDTILVNYIKNNRFVDKRIAIERRNSILRKDKLIRESKKLDTLKFYMSKSYISNQSSPTSTPNGTNVTLNSKDVNPIEIYREDLRLYEQQLKIDKQLYINSEIEIIDKFITFGKPASGSLLKYILYGGILGCLLTFIYIIFVMLRNGLIKLRYNLEN